MASPQLLVTNGTEQVAWDGTDAWLMADFPFAPATPTLRERVLTQPGIDGAEQIGADYDNVAETIQGAKFIGGVATVRANIQKLERLLVQARNYNKPGVLPVYVKFRPDSAEAWYRSQLLSGRVLWDKLMLDFQWAAGEFDITLIYRRRFYWEADTEVELPLSLATGAPSYATGGKVLTNHEDATAGHTNGVEINAAALTGDLPAPPRIEFKNSTGGTYGGIFVSHEIEMVGPVTPTLEGEAATPLVNVADALSSGGNFNRVLWASAAETDLLSWTAALTSAQLANMAGRYFRVLARFANAPAYADLWLRLKLTNSAGTILQTSKLLMKSSGLQLQELGAVQLPPHLAPDVSLATLTLVLQATRAGNGLAPVNIASSTNASPIVVTTATPHGLASGQAASIAGHLVNTAANGLWLVTVTGASTFSIVAAGNGVGVATGAVAPAAVLDLDYVQLWALDGWRKYTAVFGGIAVNDTLQDDMMAGTLRTLLAGATALKNYSAAGPPIMLLPGPNKQRLRVLWLRTTGLATVDDTLTVRAYYRPRRMTV